MDARDGRLVIWHVRLQPGTGMSRMAGAWVLEAPVNNDVEALVTGRRALVTANAHKALDTLGVRVHAEIDPSATIENIEAVRDELQAAYQDYSKRRKLTAPMWPQIPTMLNMEAPPLACSDELTTAALGIARWLASVAVVWEQIERERLARYYLPGGPGQRAMPVAVRE